MNNTSVSARAASAGQRHHFTTRLKLGLSALLVAFIAMAVALSFSSAASAATTPPGLGTTESYSVLGGQTVTNTGPTTLSGDLGVSPGEAVTGFPPGLVSGTVNAGNAAAGQAQSDLVIAYNDLAGRAPTASVSGDLAGQTYVDGVYNSSGPLGLTGTVTLDGQGDPNSVFIFQVASTLITDTGSNVALINGAQACNVYWQVGSSATLGTASNFAGSILALTSITATTGATVQGRALARNGAVTLDSNVFTTASCNAVEPSEDPTVPPTDEPTDVPTDEPTDVPTDEPTDVPTDEPTDVPTDEPTDEPTDVPTDEPTDVPTDTDAPTENPSESDTPSESPTESEAPSESGTPSSSESDTPSDEASDSDAPSDEASESDTPTAESSESDAPSDESSESDTPSDEASESQAAAAADEERSASDSADLPATGPGPLLSALIGLSALLIITGSALLITKRHRSGSSD
ncbi:ice-binding family protein [Nesterenkonia halotolerans]|uniref:ice-binding family protein n=1 Tax=Nesterenkonia halotolerans TaxID=225325 RepID=UPI003EE75DE5